MWVGIKGIISKRAGKTDKGIATLRAKNGNKMVSSSREKREALAVEHYRKLGTPKANNRFDTEFKKLKEINKWANAKVEESNGRIVAPMSCRESSPVMK